MRPHPPPVHTRTADAFLFYENTIWTLQGPMYLDYTEVKQTGKKKSGLFCHRGSADVAYDSSCYYRRVS